MPYAANLEVDAIPITANVVKAVQKTTAGGVHARAAAGARAQHARCALSTLWNVACATVAPRVGEQRKGCVQRAGFGLRAALRARACAARAVSRQSQTGEPAGAAR
eukprot:1600617-Prymnesium_polylepis.1